MKATGKIYKKGDRYIFKPVGDADDNAEVGIFPGEEELLAAEGVGRLPMGLKRLRELRGGVKRLGLRPFLPGIRPKKILRPEDVRRKGRILRAKVKRLERQARETADLAQKGILRTREAPSVAKDFYHRISYTNGFAGKSRVLFFNVFGDPDALVSNVPEPYFKMDMALQGIKVDIEPISVKDNSNDAVGYLAALQTLSSSAVQIRINDSIEKQFSFKDLTGEIETDTAFQTAAPNAEITTFRFEEKDFILFGDVFKGTIIETSPADRVSVVIVSQGAFPALATGAATYVDLSIVVHLQTRVSRRVLGA